jgi:hypothetical protein
LVLEVGLVEVGVGLVEVELVVEFENTFFIFTKAMQVIFNFQLLIL